MKFWTVLQEPLYQAALVQDGKIIKTIPANPSGTPVRHVYALARYKDNLVIGKKNSFEIWDFEGNELIKTIYCPLIYGLHEINQYKDDLIVCCTTLDVIFRMDLDGNVKWKWFAHQHGFCPDTKLLENPNWQTMQLSQTVSFSDASHLNSCRVHEDKVIASLMNNKIIIEINIGEQNYNVLLSNVKHGVHSPIIIDKKLCYATVDELNIGNRIIKYDYENKTGYLWVKRIVDHDNKIFFSHELGISYIVKNNENNIFDFVLPRPFGIVF